MARRASALSTREQILAIRAAGWLAILHVSLKVVPFRIVRKGVAALRPSGVAVPLTVAECRTAIARAVSLLPWTGCLARAIAAECLMARAGIATELKFAAAVDTARALDAHAWLECGGTIVVGDPGRLERQIERRVLE